MSKLTAFSKKFLHTMRGVPKVSLVILVLLFAAAVFADLLPLHNPEIGDPRERLLPPFLQQGGIAKYPLGTDTMGRDVLARLIYGTRISLLVAFVAVILASCVGTAIGVCSGFLGGLADQLIMRFTDAWLSIPAIMFAILLAIVLGPGASNIAIIMAIIFWTRHARVVRGETLQLRTSDFVRLATIAGVNRFRIMLRHIVPNVMNSVITIASMQIGIVVVAEASLTFLGVGVPPPKPAWGLMLSEGRAGLFTGHWWLIVFPGIAIAMMVMAFNLIGDWLRQRLDPHLRNIPG
jgi:peptide/nickel transport system permease protein